MASVFLLEVAGAQLSEGIRAFLGYTGVQRPGWSLLREEGGEGEVGREAQVCGWKLDLMVSTLPCTQKADSWWTRGTWRRPDGEHAAVHTEGRLVVDTGSLEKGMAVHPRILAQEIPWTEEPE